MRVVLLSEGRGGDPRDRRPEGKFGEQSAEPSLAALLMQNAANEIVRQRREEVRFKPPLADEPQGPASCRPCSAIASCPRSSPSSEPPACSDRADIEDRAAGRPRADKQTQLIDGFGRDHPATADADHLMSSGWPETTVSSGPIRSSPRAARTTISTRVPASGLLRLLEIGEAEAPDAWPVDHFVDRLPDRCGEGRAEVGLGPKFVVDRL